MRKLILSIAFCFFAPAVAVAGLSLSQTRVVFVAPEKQATIKVNNSSKSDALFQSWLDQDNNPLADIPFAVVPTFSKVSPEGSQILRIIAQGASLPENKESVFWLNIQEIPRVSNEFAEGSASGVSFSIRQRIKLFYRPTGVSTEPITMTKQLNMSLDSSGKRLIIQNASGNYITLVAFRTKAPNGLETDLKDVIMLSPMETSTLELNSPVKAGDDVRFESMSDTGFPRPFQLIIPMSGSANPSQLAEENIVQ